jgi:sugar phosphate isomerase/epimerase
MDEHRIGCSTSTFRSAPLDDALDRIAASGVKLVDLWMAPHWCPHFDPVSATPLAKRELRERFESRGLELASCRVTSGTFLINDEQGPEIEGRYQRRSLELAAELGVPFLLVSTGRDTWDSTFERNARLVADHLNSLGRDAQAMGVRLGIVCPHVSQLGQFFDRAKRLIAMTDAEYVGVALDTAHVRLSGGTPVAALEAYGERVVHVHLRDYKEGRYLMTPGDGDIDWAGFFRKLDAIGYGGACTLALEYPGQSVDHHETEYRRALAHVQAAARSTQTARNQARTGAG